LLWGGRLGPVADPELMLNAFARVRAELPTARLLVRGPEGPPGYREHCAAVAGRLGLAQAVDFGSPGAEGPGWGEGTVVVFSDRVRRGSGALVAAMLSGRALVATDTGVTREVLGPTGLVVPPGDPAALAVACLALLGDAPRRARLGLAGRLRAQERFAVEPEVAAYRDGYLELLARCPAFPVAEQRTGAPPRPFARPVEFWAGRAARVAGGAGAATAAIASAEAMAEAG
jgi:glycosyltransferase involved in cell wall biosynthesis